MMQTVLWELFVVHSACIKQLLASSEFKSCLKSVLLGRILLGRKEDSYLQMYADYWSNYVIYLK